ncbi:MAG TPA: glycoside hydrolase family 78 protein [Candidatus Borkfalkia excrementipullorum]|nr:glycoside hydrolase family 78 protein [Candidatus Borkfalkia excrementipullorum]
MFKITEIQCEYRNDPIGLGCASPRLMWKLSSDRAAQTAYRVIVCSTRAAALQGKGDLWDSGVVFSPAAFYAEYAGKKLASRAQCWWRVTVYSGEECAESDIGYFEIGLLRGEDWKGTWTAMPAQSSGATMLLRREFELPSAAVRARVYVCGIGFHELFVNGKKAGDALLNPSLTDFSRRVPCCAYDVTSAVRAGKNVLGLEVAHGWNGAKQALVQAYFECENGEEKEIHSSVNGGWYVAAGPTVETSIYDGEIYDARLEDSVPRNWASAEYDAAPEKGWMPAVYNPGPAGKIEMQSVEPERALRTYKPRALHELADGSLVADIGRNIAGRARVRVRGPRGSRIVLEFGERLKGDGSVDRCNLRSAKARDIYILKGDGEEEFAPRFTFHGFQYVQIFLQGGCELLSLRGELVCNATRAAGAFECSDGALNALHAMAEITERNNQQGVLTDCPQRDERFGWLNDLSSRLYQTVYNCGMERFFPKFTRDIADTQLKNGAIADTAPYYTGGRPADPVCIAYVLMPALSYALYGDVRFVRESYDGCKKWVEFLLSKSENYIVDYSYYADWVEPACYDEHTDNLYVSSVFLFWHLKLLARLARIAGREEDVPVYERHARASAAAIREKYFDARAGHFAGGTQAADALALSLGLVPEGERAAVAKNLEANVRRRGYHSTCGNIGYRHLFYALADNGYIDTALKMLKNPEYPGWGYMLANGATSVWERWESEMSSEMDSFNHPMFGSYDAFLYHYLGGIRIEENAFGCDCVTIAPVLAQGIDAVRTAFNTVRGEIRSEWRREGDTVYLHAEIPQGVAAKIIFGGKTVSVGCGSYDFSAASEAAPAYAAAK